MARGGGMTKAGKFWLIAMILGVLGLVEAVTGFVLWFGFPESGGGGGRLSGGISNLTFLGVTKHTWIDIHDWVAVALTAGVLLHIIIHWKSIIRVGKMTLKGKPNTATIIVKS